MKGVGPPQSPGSHADLGSSTDPSLPGYDCLGLQVELNEMGVLMERENTRGVCCCPGDSDGDPLTTPETWCVFNLTESPSPSPNLLRFSHL